MKQTIFLSVFITILTGSLLLHGQNEKEESIVAFYNIENLFDTLNSSGVYDEEFTPSGQKNWNSTRYKQKVSNISKVILDIGKSEGFDMGPDIIGLCEVENIAVLKDIVETTELRNSKYRIFHYDSPDFRGIDVALLYRSSAFMPDNTINRTVYIHNPMNGSRIYTRNLLLVSGKLRGEKIFFIVNHWPSRRGGELNSQPYRIAAARVCRHLVDSVKGLDADAKIIVMGDFNDEPDDISVSEYLNAHSNKNKLKENQLFNSSAFLISENMGTLKYRGKWNLFDQLIITPSLLNAREGLIYKETKIMNKRYLIQQEGKYKGYPYRNFGGNKYLNGYSDHLPTYLILRKI